MAAIKETAFEVKVSNISRNNTQNVAGTFGAGTGTSFASDICPSGMLCTQSELMENEGYTGISNGNTWRFIAAATGDDGRTGDHTGIYAFNSYDVRKGAVGGNVYALGANFLGLELPADEIGDFTEIIIGEQYKFGKGNFSTAPASASAKYVTIVNGLLVAATAAPTADGVYFEILRNEGFTQGTRYAFDGYVMVAKRIVTKGAQE